MIPLYRDATQADAALLARIGAQTFTTTFGHLYRAEDLAAFLAENHSEPASAAFLAKPAYATRFVHVGDEPAGYAMVCPADLPHLDPARATLELKRLYLLPGHFGLGLGDALMDWTDTIARARGCDQVALSVFSQNPRAIRFYQRHGFTSAGSYHFRVGQQLDEEFVYVKPLA